MCQHAEGPPIWHQVPNSSANAQAPRTQREGRGRWQREKQRGGGLDGWWLVVDSREGGGLCVVEAEGTSLAKYTSSNLLLRQSPEDINFTCTHPALWRSPTLPSSSIPTRRSPTPHPPPPETPLSFLSALALHYLGMRWHEKTQTQNPTRPWDQQLLLDLPHKQREEEGGNSKKKKTPTPQTKNAIQKHALLFQNALSHPNWPFLPLRSQFHFNRPDSTDIETH